MSTSMSPERLAELRARAAQQRQEHDEWTLASESLERPRKSVQVSCDDLDTLISRVSKLEQLAELVRHMIPDLDDTSGSFSRVDAMNEHVENLAAAIEIIDSGYTQRECMVTLSQAERDLLGEKVR